MVTKKKIRQRNIHTEKQRDRQTKQLYTMYKNTLLTVWLVSKSAVEHAMKSVNVTYCFLYHHQLSIHNHSHISYNANTDTTTTTTTNNNNFKFQFK